MRHCRNRLTQMMEKPTSGEPETRERANARTRERANARTRSPRIVHRPSLAHDGDLYLARILERLFDFLDDVPRQAHRRQVVDLLGPDDDADLSTRLNGEGLLHP